MILQNKSWCNTQSMKKSNKQFLRLLTIIFTVTIFLLSNCKKDRHSEQDIIRIRIAEEPEMISPIFSKSSISGQLSEKIFLPLADYDPGSLKLQPVLIKEIPQAIFQDGIETYELELLDSIRWQDGTPLTVNDIITTYKLILNPAQEAASVRSTLKNLHAVIVDNNNNKKFKLQFSIFEKYLRSFFLHISIDTNPCQNIRNSQQVHNT